MHREETCSNEEVVATHDTR